MRFAVRHVTTAALIIAIGAATTFVQVNAAAPEYAAVPEYTAAIVKRFPHDPTAFTEGLLYQNGFLYESTGRNGQSSIREVNPETGQIMRERYLDPRYFGEGIVIWKAGLIQLTWKNQTGFVYDLKTFRLRSEFHYKGEGWALTEGDSHLIMSDGTSDLRILSPETLHEIGRIHVTCEGRAIQNINELEWVRGEIYANIWLTNLIVRINPSTGDVVGLIDLTDLAAATVERNSDNVLNGIAYDAAGDRLFVTGKLWPTLYQISLSRRPVQRDLCRAPP
jgi:glutaminyl-peptide cyclotransferase